MLYEYRPHLGNGQFVEVSRVVPYPRAQTHKLQHKLREKGQTKMKILCWKVKILL